MFSNKGSRVLYELSVESAATANDGPWKLCDASHFEIVTNPSLDKYYLLV